MDLNGKTIAILATDGFEQVELTEPKQALENADAKVVIVAPQSGQIRGWNEDRWGDSVDVNRSLDETEVNDYDGLQMPGRLNNPDQLRRNEKATAFVRGFFKADKPVAAICHAPWTLIDAGVIDGRKLTSYHTLQTDLRNAGAEWVDEQVVVDNGLVTSRNPGDLAAFKDKMVEEFAEGKHARQSV